MQLGVLLLMHPNVNPTSSTACLRQTTFCAQVSSNDPEPGLPPYEAVKQRAAAAQSHCSDTPLQLGSGDRARFDALLRDFQRSGAVKDQALALYVNSKVCASKPRGFQPPDTICCYLFVFRRFTSISALADEAPSTFPPHHNPLAFNFHCSCTWRQWPSLSTSSWRGWTQSWGVRCVRCARATLRSRPSSPTLPSLCWSGTSTTSRPTGAASGEKSCCCLVGARPAAARP
jgi:hypothetical protein